MLQDVCLYLSTIQLSFGNSECQLDGFFTGKTIDFRLILYRTPDEPHFSQHCQTMLVITIAARGNFLIRQMLKYKLQRQPARSCSVSFASVLRIYPDCQIRALCIKTQPEHTHTLIQRPVCNCHPERKPGDIRFFESLKRLIKHIVVSFLRLLVLPAQIHIMIVVMGILGQCQVVFLNQIHSIPAHKPYKDYPTATLYNRQPCSILLMVASHPYKSAFFTCKKPAPFHDAGFRIAAVIPSGGAGEAGRRPIPRALPSFRGSIRAREWVCASFCPVRPSPGTPG